jgi:hypothetical protein
LALEVYANFHDQASIIGVALEDASNILAVNDPRDWPQELFRAIHTLFTRFHIHLRRPASEIAQPHAMTMRMMWIKRNLGEIA